MKLTLKGALTAAGAILLASVGLVFDAPVVGSAGLAGLALLAGAAFTVKSVEIRATRETSSQVGHEGAEVKTRLRVEAHGLRGKVFAEIRDTLPEALEVSSGSNYVLTALSAEPLDLDYVLRAPIKGKFTLGPVRLRVQDAFGLFHEDRDVDRVTFLTVYPRQFDLRDALTKSKFPLVVAGDYIVGQPGYGSSFFALREYMTGDPYRSINWKASARSKNFIVNQTERETQARVTILFDNREVARLGSVRDNAIVYGSRAAVSLAGFLLKRRDKMRLIFYEDAIREVRLSGTEKPIVPLSEALADANGKGAMKAMEAVTALLPTLKPRSPIIIVSSLLDDGTVSEAVRALRAYEMRVLVVTPRSTTFLEKAGVSTDSSEYATAVLERETAIAQMKSYGAVVVDWDTAEPITVTFAREALL